MFGTIAALLQVLARAAGARGVDAGIVDALVFGANLVEEGMEGKAELEALTKRIQGHVDAGTHFSDAERAEMRERSDAAHSRLQALADDAPEPEADAGPDTEATGEVAAGIEAETEVSADLNADDASEPDPAEDTPPPTG